MNTKTQNKEEIYKEIADFFRSKGATKVAVFGSYVRDEETPESDIDLLVDFNLPITIYDFAGFKLDLEEKLGRKVDLVMEDAVNPLLEKFIRKDLRVLYQ